MGILAQETVVSVGPWLGVITTVIMWTGFLITLALLKGFISFGANIAIAEFMLGKGADTTTREKICRWFGNGEEIEAVLRDMDEKMSRERSA